jgi:hypothetical protein
MEIEKTQYHMEKAISNKLPEIMPNPDFVEHLKHQLTNSTLFKSHREKSAKIVILLLGLLVGILLLILTRLLHKNERTVT